MTIPALSLSLRETGSARKGEKGSPRGATLDLYSRYRSTVTKEKRYLDFSFQKHIDILYNVL